jgi:hypothetical protein
VRIKFRVLDKKEKKMYSRIWTIQWVGLDKGIEVRETASSIKFEDADLRHPLSCQITPRMPVNRA